MENSDRILEKIKELAKDYGVDSDDLLDEINAVRVVSNLMMNSILDLLSEIANKEVDNIVRNHNISNDEVINRMDKVQYEIFSAVQKDELLITLLDVALKMTGTEIFTILFYQI